MDKHTCDFNESTLLMEPITLDGKTLGLKHQSYNKKLIELLSYTVGGSVTKINYDDSDINNLLKIDIACQIKLVDYILDIFKCKDLLYVSRAIKNSTWLITDPQYASIIDPDFIHHQLLPFMSTKAYNKFMLHVRKNLRSEHRVDKFYTYYEEKDLNLAFKWLPHSSPSLIEKVLKIYGKEIPAHIMKRLVKKSDYVSTYCQNVFNEDNYNDFQRVKEILQCDHPKYLDFLNHIRVYDFPKMSANKTKKIMHKCPEKVLNEISKYISKLHIKTFAKCMGPDNIQEFLITNSNNPYMKPFYKYDKLKYFIKNMNETERLKLIKGVFIDKQEAQYTSGKNIFNNTMIRCLTNMNNEYVWCEIMPFDLAYVELKKYIEYELNPKKKCSMLETLVSCACNNQNYIYEVLRYYHTHHINEANKHKARFVHNILKKSDSLHFNESIWHLLNNIFLSMGIYTDIDSNNEEKYVDFIILYNIIHSYPVPDAIMKKFKYKTFKNIQEKLNESEKNIVFKFLLQLNLDKLHGYNLSDTREFEAVLECLKGICKLLCDWKKNISDHHTLVFTINEIIMFLKNQGKEKELKNLSQVGKCVDRLIVNKLLLINIRQNNYYLYALKHNPDLFNGQIENILCKSEELPNQKFLLKLRVYWKDSLATEFKDTCTKGLGDNNYSSVRRAKVLLSLLSQSEVKDFVQQYFSLQNIDSDYKESDSLVTTRKRTLKMLYVCRPHVSIETLSLPSSRSSFLNGGITYNFLLHNMNQYEMQIFILKYANFPVTLRKIILRIAVIKLKHDDIVKLYQETWSTKNSRSVRALIFKQTFNLLCASKKDKVSEDLWVLLSKFIESLTFNEHTAIYELLCNIDKIPLHIRRHFYEKASNLLKQMPDESYYKILDKKLNINNYDMRQILNIQDVLNQGNEELQNLRKKRTYIYWLPEYLINSNTEESQMEKYHATLLPFLKHVLEMWNKGNHVKPNFLGIMERMFDCLGRNFINREVLPIAMFSDIQERMTQELPFDENYLFLRSLSISISLFKSVKKYEKSNFQNDIIPEVYKEFGKVCNEQLYEDIKKYTPTIYMVFGQALDNFFRKLCLGNKQTLNVLQGLMSDNPQQEIFLIVVDLLPRRVFDVDEYNLRSILIEKLMQHPSHEVKMYFKNNFIQL